MNKDADERLVPKGEYRNAMNIQVSTSEGSDVGAVENLLGNMPLTDLYIVPFDSRCVGAIADEKNDCFYWFVQHKDKDLILKYHNGNVIPIVVDLFPSDPKKRILAFPKRTTNNLITGINIIDDLLFWTDGSSEPKKINVKLCQQGTDVTGSYHTKLVAPKANITISNNILLREDHITVIKKYPLTPLTLEPKYTKVITSEIRSQNPFADPNNPGDLLPVGDIVIADFDNFENGSGYSVNDEILLLNSNGQLPTNFDVRVKVVEDISGGGGTNPGNPSGYSNVYKIQILSINPNTTTGNPGGLMFKAENVNKEELMFEKKFPRFSYRWRYQDGEYSSFAPFTSVVFEPGKFLYDTKSAFNKGMDRYLVGLNLRNFLPVNTPQDVVQVDILYKDSRSPTVYIVDTIKPNDRESISIGNAEESYLAENFNNPGFNMFGNHLLNCWDANSFELESDVIFSTTPENQLSRPWDHVPRFAKAQELSANRLIYGNYTQNFDILEKPTLVSKYITRYPDNIRYKPLFLNNYTDSYILQEEDISPSSDLYLYGQKSLKSMREYQVGVTFLDKYGRETPVFSDAKASFQVKKKHGKFKTSIETRLTNDPPYWAEYMKFYVKETATEYYNLVMDRIYDAKDGHFWLSFPSSDINKVREDSYLILKKGESTNSMIIEEAKYKVIDINKSAPDYIKTKVISVGSSAGSETPTLTQGSPIVINQRYFEIDEDTWVGSGNAKLSEITEKLTLDFSTTTQTSKIYDIVAVDILENGGIDGGRSYKITLDRIVDTEDKWIYPNYPTIISGSLPDLDSSVQINIYKNIKENRPEFDGKFFVKIYGDSVVNQHLLLNSGSVQYQVDARIDPYLFLDSDATSTIVGSSGYTTTGFNKSDTMSRWKRNLDVSDPSDNVMDRVWFLDNAYYKGSLPLNFGPNDELSDEDTSSAYGQGFHQINGKWYMDISYGQIHQDVHYSQYTSIGVHHTIETNVPWDGEGDEKELPSNLIKGLKEADKLWGVGTPGNSFDAVQADVVSKLVKGTKFRFAGDTSGEIFEIDDDPIIKRLFNHTMWYHVQSEFDAWEDEDFDLGDNWNGDEYVQYRTRLGAYGNASNRRLRYKIPIDKDPNLATIKPYTNTNTTTFTVADNNTPFGIEFIQEKYVRGEASVSMNPAIWETEPKESEGLDIYHEASQAYPVKITPENSELYIPINSIVTRPGGEDAMQTGVTTRVTQVEGFNGTSEISLRFNEEISLAMANVNINVPFRFTKVDGSFVTLYLADLPTGPLPHFPGVPPFTYEFKTDIAKNPIGLDWFNCFSFGNGVESNRIRDDFNQVTLDKGPVVSSTIDSNYETEHRTSGLIFSGIYNSTTGVNNLNQFLITEGITKDLNPFYGSIQKLFSRNNDLLAFCEDKVLRILANKDAMFNADGNPQLLSTNRVLGQAMPFAGEFGISKNPESFASDAFRVYFTDKTRSAVLRLSMDGVTVISDYGMSDWFSDNLKNNNHLIGSFDNDKNEYNLTLVNSATTVSFDDEVNGWCSFKSFVTDFGALSLGSDYYTFNEGLGYKHHVELDKQGNQNPRNTFYGVYTPSSVSVVLNDEAGVIKSFKTLGYEGSQSYINQETTDVRTGFYNLIQKDGWSVEHISTDKQKGNVSEFIEKEGKWFNYIKGIDVAESLDIKTDEFSFQGIGKILNMSVDTSRYHIEPPVIVNGCMDPNASNYNPNATQDDGSCVYVQQIPGCTDPNANNYNPLATYDDGSCVIDIPGCMDPNASNYNPLATVDDGSCFLTPIYGCTNPNATNYDSTATVDDGSCILPVPGCTDPTADNYNPLATYDDGSCIWAPPPGGPGGGTGGGNPQAIPGCMDPAANNYDPLATIDDGSCTYTPNSLTIQDSNDPDTSSPPPPNY